MFGLLTWHIWYVPRWLITLTWNLERAAVRYFSAGLILRTLVAHWHKDAVPYQQGTVSGIALAFAWNMISRGFGFFVRTVALVFYAVVAGCIAILGLVSVVFFWVWPLAAVFGIIIGARLLA